MAEESGLDIARTLNEETLGSNGELEETIPEAGNEIARLNPDTQIALPSNQNESQPTQSEVVVAGGTYHGTHIGPKSSKKVVQSHDYRNAKITHIHYHGETAASDEPSTSGSQAPKRRRLETSETEEGYIQISDDIFMNSQKPLREGAQIFEGYQEHVCGNRLPIAIKRIVPCTDAHIREVEHLVKLASHPNVVRIIQSKERQSDVHTLYIAMELCSSQNLHDYLDEKRHENIPFDFKKAMSFTKQLDGMKFIHSNGVIHRDMKPENVLLSVDKQQIKITDFGLGKQLRHGRSITKVTYPGQGTEGYRAPETYSSDVISKQADIFSLGLTMFGVWSYGKHPFGDDVDLLNYNIKKNKGRELSGLKISGTKKDELIDLIDKMLQHDHRLRPTIEEVSQHSFFIDELNLPREVTLRETNVERNQRSAQIDVEDQTVEAQTVPKEVTNAGFVLESRTPVLGRDPEVADTGRYFFSREEEASRLLPESKFEEAIDMLKDLPQTERQQIMLAQCFFRVGKDVEACDCIERLKGIMMSLSPRPNPKDVIKTIENYIDGLLFIRALILLPCASKLCTSHPDSYEALWLFVLCLWRCSKVIGAMSNQGDRMKTIAADTGIKTVHAIHADLLSIHGADPARKADMEARCLNDIASSYYSIGKVEEAIKYSKNGYHVMESHFGPDAPKYSVFNRLLRNRASFNMKFGDYQEAERLYLECSAVEKLAEDYPSLEEMEKTMEMTKTYLKVAQDKMKSKEK